MRVISGGQTGVDRAALDVALACNLPCGGWCPKGRRAEDGVIAARYPLTETPSTDYRRRTAWNVRDSDATLIILRGEELRGGTALTRDHALRLGKPFLIVDLAAPESCDQLLRWLGEHAISTLNVAGPRESQQPGIHAQASALLHALFSALRESASGRSGKRRNPSDR